MQAWLKTHNDGTVALHLDVEAARAVFASILFAAKFHPDIVPLAQVSEQALRGDRHDRPGSEDLCQ
jgi:hypothetical protein